MPNEFVGAVTQADDLQHLLLEKLGNSFLGKLQPGEERAGQRGRHFQWPV
jgi:hypothetical protein